MNERNCLHSVYDVSFSNNTYDMYEAHQSLKDSIISKAIGRL